REGSRQARSPRQARHRKVGRNLPASAGRALQDACLHDKTILPDTKLIRIDVQDIERTVFPPSLTCTYSDSEADLLAPARTGLLGCGVAFVAFAGAALSQAARAGRPRPGM
ncbi:hypothetical protein ACFV0X_47295, partial [Streptomyces mirabilis]